MNEPRNFDADLGQLMRAVEASAPDSPDLAARLVASVTEAADRSRGTDGVRRWVTPLLAAAAVVALLASTSLVLTLMASRHPQPTTKVQPVETASASPTASPTPSPHPSARTPRPTLLGHGRQGERGDVPWDQVGSGWVLVVWAANGSDYSTPPPTTLFLVDPLGGRYAMARFSTVPALLDWSHDGRFALLRRRMDGDVVERLDLRTGTSVRLVRRSSEARFAPPGSDTFLQSDASGVTVRTRLDGTVLTTYPTLAAGPSQHVDLVSPDGRTLIFAHDQPEPSPPPVAQLFVVSIDGRVLHRIRTPAGYTFCHPYHWWQPEVAVGECYSSTKAPRVWLFPTSGAASTPLTADLPQPPGDPVAGYEDAWRTTTGTFVTNGGCATPPEKLNRRGTGDAVVVPRPPGVEYVSDPVTAYGDVLILATGYCEGPPGGLMAWNSATGRSSVLIGEGMNGGVLVGVVSFPLDG